MWSVQPLEGSKDLRRSGVDLLAYVLSLSFCLADSIKVSTPQGTSKCLLPTGYDHALKALHCPDTTESNVIYST